MTKITKEEILRLAFLSRIEIEDDEVEPIRQQLQDVLSYAQKVKEVVADIDNKLDNPSNVMREDVDGKTSPEKILEQAPEREDDFFVVPRILSNK